MYKKTRIKIVSTIMAVIILILAVALALIYAASYREIFVKSQDMLKNYAGIYQEKGLPDGMDVLPDQEFSVSTFYAVVFSADGAAEGIDNGLRSSLSESEIVEAASAIRDGGRQSGEYGKLVYYVSGEENGTTLVVMMDNTIRRESFSTLFRYTLIFGACALILFFFLALFLAKKIVDPLEERDNQRKQFISDAGHELKTPIAVVSANAEMLAREIGANAWLSNIQFENERMAALTRRLLDLTRVESEPPVMEKVDLSRVVTGSALPFESVAFEKGAVLNYEIEDNITVRGDSERLTRLTAILLDNAVEYCRQNGNIKISLKKERHVVKLSVSNEGKEIPKEQRKRIFARFCRGDAARNGEDNHFGLGLAIAARIVENHKGKISVDCEGGVTTFTVTLPVGEMKAEK